jgi:hypothetical protein
MTYRERFFAGADLLGVLGPADFPREHVSSSETYSRLKVSMKSVELGFRLLPEKVELAKFDKS